MCTAQVTSSSSIPLQGSLTSLEDGPLHSTVKRLRPNSDAQALVPATVLATNCPSPPYDRPRRKAARRLTISSINIDTVHPCPISL